MQCSGSARNYGNRGSWGAGGGSSIDSGGNQVSRLLRLGSAEFCAVAVEPVERLTVYLSDDKGWLATFELEEALRDDALQTVAALQTQGAQVFLCSGMRLRPFNAWQSRWVFASSRRRAPAGKLDYLQQLQAQGANRGHGRRRNQ